MAHLDKIQPPLLTRVAGEIGEFIDRGSKTKPKEPKEAGETPLQPGKTPLRLRETLTVWKFQARAFEALLTDKKLSGDLFDWVEPADALYHQIWLGGKPAGFARSHHLEEGEKRAVFQFSASPLASQLNQYFERIDRDEQDPFLAKDPVVRLVEIPPFQISALWLFVESPQPESRVLIIYAPKRYKDLHEGAMVTSEQFFNALSVGPILDITTSPEEEEDKSRSREQQG